ncbi:MAG: PD-(D/E)XK nuclease family protein, partial [Muribaculaceae bacterium]|nr:PD-(D/E)XK nuclease family protein [Muribaculaceae bacterium]
INFVMYIDRLDRTSEGWRIIDYKTGKDELSTGGNLDNLFNPAYKGAVDGIFQLLTYAEAYRDITGDENVKIMLAIHALRKIAVDGEIKPLYHNKSAMEAFPALSAEFRPRLNSVISEIFDSETPFTQSVNKDACRYCKFRSMCGRVEESVDYSD